MTAGIYLVSACGSAEEFVAAFRRYTDKTGLFVPIASPLPQGKKGRIAITLVDGGVMLEGEVEIVQSSAKSPLHGRPGIQLKFVDADEPTKTLLAELDKARLAMKPAPPSVAPRPASIAASPRPTPPPIGGRIDAANALAECVAIGDASKLEDAGPPKAGPKFVVPSIPALGGPARPKTPSTPPEGIAAPPVGKLTTMGMPAIRPPAPDSGPVRAPADTGAMKPADTGAMRPPSETGAVRTDRGDPTPLPAPRTDPTPMPTSSRTSTLRDAVPPVRTEAPVPTRTAAFDAAWDEEDAAPNAPAAPNTPAAKVGSAPTAVPNAPAAPNATAAPNAPAANVGSAPTSVANAPAAPNTPAAKVGSAPTAAPNAPAAKVGSAPTAAPNAPAAKVGSAPTAAPAPTAVPNAPAAPNARAGNAGSAPSAADNGGMPLPKAPSKSKMTQIGFPVVKAPADGPPKATVLGMVPLRADEPTATGAPPAPAPPKLPDADKPAKPPLPQPTPTRSKSPTAPPRNPTPHVPLPVAKLPAKPAPMLADDGSDEKTDLTSAPIEPGTGEILIESKPPLDDPAPEAKPQRSGGMRASEIMAAVTSDDWTMTPDASAPTVLPADKHAPAIEEPTPGPTPTGDWTMSLDPAAGWSKPEQVATPTPPAEKPTRIERPKAAIQTPATGNELKSVSSDKPIEVQAWEDKPTSIGEKIEIDATLMEPLTPLPAVDADEARPGNGSGSFGAMTEQMPAASANGLAAAGSVPGMAAFEPAHRPNATGPEAAIAPPPLPLPPPPTLPPPLPQEIPIGYAPTLLPGQMTAPPPPPPPPLQYATAQPGDLYRSESFPLQPQRSNKKLFMIIGAAVLVVGVAIVLALTMGHGKKKPLAEQHTGSAAVVVMNGSGSAQAEVVMPAVQDAAVATPPPSIDAAAVAPPKSDTCSVEVTTTPPGAEVALDDKTVLGTTPATLTLPCGQATKLNIKKAKFLGVIRTVTPKPEGVKLAVSLGVATFAVKITSTPAGATIFVGGKSKGVTPAAVQLPAFQTVKIVVSKDGYAPDVGNVVIKANNMSHHVTLKKAGRRSSESHGLKGI